MGITYEFDALGTHWWIELFGVHDFPALLRELIEEEVTDFEKNYSRFIDDSLVTSLNNHKYLDSPPPELVSMLEFALRMNKDTKGLFNISVGGKLEQLGYGRTPGTSVRISPKLDRDVLFSPNRITLADSTRIDLGGFGKGWLVDKLSDLLSDHGHKRHIVNGGGDIRLCADKPQKIYIEHPEDPGQIIGEVNIKSGGLAASSSNRRQWTNASGKHHHVIDPKQNKSVSNLASVHIYADTTLLADTLSTVFLLVDDVERQELAKKFTVEYLAINYDLSFYETARFPAKMY